MAREAGSIIAICPKSAGRPILSCKSPLARVMISPVALSNPSTQNWYFSVVRKSSSVGSPAGRHSFIVAIRPYTGTSYTG